MNREDSHQLVRHAYMEQQKLKLSWFSSIVSITEKFDNNMKESCQQKIEILPNSKLVRDLDRTSEWFKDIWNSARKQNRKLDFYN